MRIASILDISLVDIPGIPASVIFTAGCNFDCPYCHNSSLISPLAGEDMELVDVIMAANNGINEGVCITGGEPTLHTALPLLLKGLRESGIRHINLNTQGSNPTILRQCIPYLDSVWFDLKAAPQRYSQVTRTKYDFWPKVRESFITLQHSNVQLWPRTTFVGGLNKPEDIRMIFEFFREIDFKGEYLIQNYVVSDGVRERERESFKSLDEEYIKGVVQKFKNNSDKFVVVFNWR